MSSASGASNRRTTASSRYPGSRVWSSSVSVRFVQRTNIRSHTPRTTRSTASIGGGGGGAGPRPQNHVGCLDDRGALVSPAEPKLIARPDRDRGDDPDSVGVDL